MKKSHFLNRASPRQQQGLALFISMMLLLIITIMGLMSLRSTSFQESMVANARDRMVGFQAAESAILTAEEYLRTTYTSSTVGNTFTAACTNGLCLAVDNTVMATKENWLNSAVWSTASKHATLPTSGAGFIDGVNTAPSYIIEVQKGNCANSADNTLTALNPDANQYIPVVIFRITARGVGASADTVVMLQTNYGVSGIVDLNNSALGCS